MTTQCLSKLSLALLATGALSLAGCASLMDDVENEVEIDLADVPAEIMAVAQDAVPGIQIDEAEFEEEDGAMIYELEGMLGEQRYEIEIGQDGEIIEIEAVEEED